MKQIFFFFIFALLCCRSIFSQTNTDYNFRGDEALKIKDYDGARIWFSEGLTNCDPYSIRKLTDIWKEQTKLQNRMYLTMKKCFNCLETSASAKGMEAMLLISEYYKHGIGVAKDSIQADYWLKEYGKILGFSSGAGDSIQNIPILSAQKKSKKSIFTDKFYIFANYTYSPTMPYGLTVGIYDKYGLYISYRTDRKTLGNIYDCNNTEVFGIDAEDPKYWFDREKWVSQMWTGGIIYPLFQRKVFFTLGGGYGKREYLREIRTEKAFSTGSKSEWVHNIEASYNGWLIEAGGLLRMKKFVITAGVNSTLFRDIDIYIGFGYSF